MPLSDHCGYSSHNMIHITLTGLQHTYMLHTDNIYIVGHRHYDRVQTLRLRKPSMASRQIPSSMCFLTLHPYLLTMPAWDLANLLNAIHNPMYMYIQLNRTYLGSFSKDQSSEPHQYPYDTYTATLLQGKFAVGCAPTKNFKTVVLVTSAHAHITSASTLDSKLTVFLCKLHSFFFS